MNPIAVNPNSANAVQFYSKALRGVTTAANAVTAKKNDSVQSATSIREAEEALQNLLDAIRVQKRRDSQLLVEKDVLETTLAKKNEMLESICKEMDRIAGSGERFYVRDVEEATAAADLVRRFPNLQCSFWTTDNEVFIELEVHGIRPYRTPN